MYVSATEGRILLILYIYMHVYIYIYMYVCIYEYIYHQSEALGSGGLGHVRLGHRGQDLADLPLHLLCPRLDLANFENQS